MTYSMCTNCNKKGKYCIPTPSCYGPANTYRCKYCGDVQQPTKEEEPWWVDEVGYDPGISQEDYERIERELAKERAWFSDDSDECNAWWGGY